MTTKEEVLRIVKDAGFDMAIFHIRLDLMIVRLIELAKQAGAAEDRAKNGRNKFFVDGLAYYTGQTALTVAEIKRIAGTSNYHMFYDNPDGAFLGDGEAIRLDGEVHHFFVVPPATF